MSTQLDHAIATVNRPEMEPVQESVTPMGLLQVAMSQNADMDKLMKLMDMQERWEANEARKAFNASMAKFKANPPQITKNKHVKFGNTEYDHATLDHVSERITSALSAVGISHKWAVEQNQGQIAVSCILTHEKGHSESTTLTAGSDSSGSKNAIQALGSAVTYLQRYTLLAATGMAAGADDDGNGNGKAGGGSMDTDEFDRLCGLIENAGSVESLKSIYLAAAKDANDKGDKAAVKQFAAIKDKRYKELHNASH